MCCPLFYTEYRKRCRRCSKGAAPDPRRDHTNRDIPEKRQRGGEEDVVKAWTIYYKSQGRDKIARFNHKGRLGVPYLQFKAK